MTEKSRFSSAIAAVACASLLWAAEASAGSTVGVSTAPGPYQQPPADALRSMLRPDLVRSIAAWGVFPHEVIEDVGRLEDADVARVVAATRGLAGRDLDRSARDQAMYLVLVAHLRTSLLFARVLTRMHSASAGEAPATAPCESLAGAEATTCGTLAPR